MMLSPVGANSGVTITDRTTAGGLGRDFMTLLVAQLRMQDPLEPLSGAELLSQLVQLQSLSELSQMRASLSDFAGLTQLGPAIALVGRTVDWLDPATGERLSGTVTRLELGPDGTCTLLAGGVHVALRQVVAVS